jgi:uncharacterized protein YdeI (YjbR/CyaY-like superfamily)
MASFKQHCAFGFWKGCLILDDECKSADAMGQFGRITSLQDLPPRRILIEYIKKARQLNEQGVKLQKSKPRSEKKELAVPDYFRAAVKKNKKALATFEGFSHSRKNEYLEWVTEAKTEETRERHLKTTVEWLAQSKSAIGSMRNASGD